MPLLSHPPGSIEPVAVAKTVQVNCHWACGRMQALELDHWPQRHELPADARARP